ncbi:hypothetical protein LPB140_08050 [Sphingorhabdus lutea]|uniref:Uncharacterized protein n=1 Tax=Sphingorhabdus lutea TaxID=1913578 RepID=A0A1L3JCC7_9SPHN|nr:hypothetical protein LPB140_08050 [Sphingorhabdus lutea]
MTFPILQLKRHPHENGDPETLVVFHWIPAFAGMTKRDAGITRILRWIPAFAGMTKRGAAMTREKRENDVEECRNDERVKA